MGKSNSLIFQEYSRMVAGLEPASTAFLGFDGENEFTRGIPGRHDMYDLALKNWNINDDWSLGQKYDLIVSTRCPYFSRDPQRFLDKCRDHLNPGGRIFIDWGLGDHWRFPSFKVGWVRDGEHEFAYAPDNFLHSCMWRTEFQGEPEAMAFWDHVRDRFGYDPSSTLDEAVRAEVPKIIDYDYDIIRFKFLWPDAPQLYIMTLI